MPRNAYIQNLVDKMLGLTTQNGQIMIWAQKGNILLKNYTTLEGREISV